MFKVVAYLQAGVTYEVPAKNLIHGREIANRIITEGLWVTEAEGVEVFFPVHLVTKVKVLRVAAE